MELTTRIRRRDGRKLAHPHKVIGDLRDLAYNLGASEVAFLALDVLGLGVGLVSRKLAVKLCASGNTSLRQKRCTHEEPVLRLGAEIRGQDVVGRVVEVEYVGLERNIHSNALLTIAAESCNEAWVAAAASESG